MASFDKKKDTLKGSSGEETGGLIIQKKHANDDNDDGFKRPKGSLLGLDTLAREKRKQQALLRDEKESERELDKSDTKRYCIETSRKDEETIYDRGDVRVSFGNTRNTRDRHYRYSNSGIAQLLNSIEYLVLI